MEEKYQDAVANRLKVYNYPGRIPGSPLLKYRIRRERNPGSPSSPPTGGLYGSPSSHVFTFVVHLVCVLVLVSTSQQTKWKTK